MIRQPDDVVELIRVAELRTTDLMSRSTGAATGFVPSNASTLFQALRTICDCQLANGNSFCEWGSGVGTVTCVAAKLGWDAHGIEIDYELVDQSMQLASEFSLAAEFVQGSFLPPTRRQFAEEAFRDNLGRYPWLNNRADDADENLGRGIESFDVVFADPWPGEMYYIEQVFISESADGALLLIYDDSAGISVWRKVTHLPNLTIKQHASHIVDTA